MFILGFIIGIITGAFLIVGNLLVKSDEGFDKNIRDMRKSRQRIKKAREERDKCQK